MLFGHQNDDTNQTASDTAMSGVNPLAVDPETGASLPVAPEDLGHDSSADTPVLEQPLDDSAPADSSVVAPSEANMVPPVADAVTTAPLSDPVSGPAAPASDDSDAAVAAPADDELLSLKQQALQQLSPLVDHLDQTPEEKFRTTMMLIQSSDNQALIKDAYAAAQAITDEKIRAQALLDIVNEINYFTQKS